MSITGITRAVTIRPVRGRADQQAFIDLPKRLYAGTPQWVPPFDLDMRSFLRRRHPYFRHTETEFLLAVLAGRVVGRTLLIRNDRYNREHGGQCLHFYFTDFEDDIEVSGAIFSAMAAWGEVRGLTTAIGPLFSGPTFGGGVLVEGFEHTAAMTMMPYNHPYYPLHYEAAGFTKHFDLNSLSADPKTFRLPERVERLADRVRARGRMQVLRFSGKRDLRRIADDVAAMYNTTLADHSENYPLTDEELEQVKKDLLLIAQPDLEKIITYDGRVIGFMLAFPDITPTIQASRGRLDPLSLVRLLRAPRRAKKLILNGMGILPEYQRLGGNALIYSEIVRSVTESNGYDFEEAEMVQVNEETSLMLSDLYTLGARPFKLHRVYRRG